MSKIAILDEALFVFDVLEKSTIPMKRIYSEIKNNREQRGIDVGDLDCLQSYIHWSILDNSGGRGENHFTIKSDGDKEIVEKNLDK